MSGDSSFLVEDFIHAITTQLDRVQDALRIKAVNRPLTYALRDLSLDLKVFVDMDEQGNVRFRASGPNEEGASVVKLGFTTITRPMIEENTISMASARSTPLDELGLNEDEKRKLERVGVSNVAQLERLGQSAGVKAVSRISDVPMDRIRQAISMGQPRVGGVAPSGRPQPPRPSPPIVKASPPPPPPHSPAPPPVIRAQPAPPVSRPPTPPRSVPPPPRSRVVRVAPGTKKIDLFGQNLLNQEELPSVTLNARPLTITGADHDRLELAIPPDSESGALEIRMPDGETHSFALEFEEAFDATQEEAFADPWAGGIE